MKLLLNIFPDNFNNSPFIVTSWQAFTITAMIMILYFIFKVITVTLHGYSLRQYKELVTVKREIIDDIRKMMYGLAVEIENVCEKKLEEDPEYKFSDEDIDNQFNYVYKTVLSSFTNEQLDIIQSLWNEESFKTTLVLFLNECREKVRTGRNNGSKVFVNNYNK